MVLADTSVWIDHFRREQTRFLELLRADRICIHPFVIGELACGHLPKRREVLGLLSNLPAIPLVSDEECLRFLEEEICYGLGLGYIDIHLLVAARRSGVSLWTMDGALHVAAANLGIAHGHHHH